MGPSVGSKLIGAEAVWGHPGECGPGTGHGIKAREAEAIN